LEASNTPVKALRDLAMVQTLGARVPHPRRFFAFPARVGRHESQNPFNSMRPRLLLVACGFADPRQIKPGPINAAANSLTRYPAERANPLHLIHDVPVAFPFT
jgi:hypothetical protein